MKRFVPAVSAALLLTMLTSANAVASTPSRGSSTPAPRGPSSGWNAGAVVTTIVAGILLVTVLVVVFVRRRRGLFE